MPPRKRTWEPSEAAASPDAAGAVGSTRKSSRTASHPPPGSTRDSPVDLSDDTAEQDPRGGAGDGKTMDLFDDDTFYATAVPMSSSGASNAVSDNDDDTSPTAAQSPPAAAPRRAAASASKRTSRAPASVAPLSAFAARAHGALQRQLLDAADAAGLIRPRPDSSFRPAPTHPALRARAQTGAAIVAAPDRPTQRRLLFVFPGRLQLLRAGAAAARVEGLHTPNPRLVLTFGVTGDAAHAAVAAGGELVFQGTVVPARSQYAVLQARPGEQTLRLRTPEELCVFSKYWWQPLPSADVDADAGAETAADVEGGSDWVPTVPRVTGACTLPSLLHSRPAWVDLLLGRASASAGADSAAHGAAPSFGTSVGTGAAVRTDVTPAKARGRGRPTAAAAAAAAAPAVAAAPVFAAAARTAAGSIFSAFAGAAPAATVVAAPATPPSLARRRVAAAAGGAAAGPALPPAAAAGGASPLRRSDSSTRFSGAGVGAATAAATAVTDAGRGHRSLSVFGNSPSPSHYGNNLGGDGGDGGQGDGGGGDGGGGAPYEDSYYDDCGGCGFDSPLPTQTPDRPSSPPSLSQPLSQQPPQQQEASDARERPTPAAARRLAGGSSGGAGDKTLAPAEAAAEEPATRRSSTRKR